MKKPDPFLKGLDSDQKQYRKSLIPDVRISKKRRRSAYQLGMRSIVGSYGPVDSPLKRYIAKKSALERRRRIKPKKNRKGGE